MFLKRLDVVGFKSFAERISVEFVPGVTAVVGPNGSGKSNVTDAIRWVLGEQSAKSLRGSKMEDIIFAGSDSRKALNVAEVTLTLQNEDHFLPVDYHEVSITRRVYRSGESEFLINKQSCRLKDIVDLFMDSGLGREAFSIISQGKVEEILSSKAEERRSIFEEAAGVLKYKHRKRKAENKLFETQENLNRVEDIIYEIEAQVEPLKEQSAVAKDYLEKKEELEKTEVSLIAYEIEELHKKWDYSLKHLEELKDQEIQQSSLIQKEEANIEQLKESIASLDQSITGLQDVLLSSSQELEKLEGQKEVLKERKKNASENKSQLLNRVSQLDEKVKSYHVMLEQERLIYAQYEEELNNSKQKLEQADQKMKAIQQNIEEEIEELKSEYIDILNAQASYRNEKNYLEQQISQQGGKKGRLDDQNKQFLDKRSEVESRKQEIESSLLTTKKELHNKQQALDSHQNELTKKQEEHDKRQSQLYKAYQYIQQYRSKKEMLEDLQEDYSGFFQGVKAILKSGMSGIEGAVAELINVDRQYETAIEVALGSAMQQVVVDTEVNARKAIQYLKQSKSGRATFLPISVIKRKEISESQQAYLKGHPAFIGIGSDLVSFEERYEGVVKSLLGNLIVSKDLKGANEIARLINFRYRIVTLEGDVVNPGGAMTGGSLKKNTNSLLGRSRELEDISEKLADIEVKTEKFEKQVKGLKQETTDMQEFLEVLRKEIEQIRFAEQSLESKIREIKIEEQNINERLSIYDHEMKSFSDEQQSLTKRLEQIEASLQESCGKANELEKQIAQLSEKKKSQDTSKEELQVEVTELKVVTAEKQQLLKSQSEKLERLEEEYAEYEKELNETKEDYHLLTDEMTSNSSGENRLSEDIVNKKLEKERTLQLINHKREDRLKLQTRQEDIERELKETNRQHRQVQMTLKDEEVKANRLDVELENRLEHLREEYTLTFEAAREKYPKTEDAEDSRKKVKLIKKAIEELGRVNLGAIDEYERLSERFSFLSEQKDDLLEAKNTLHQVIGEMDVEMKKRFETTFYSIKEQFEKVFVQLFGGGRADLRLTNPNDLLNTGVDIVAQPPGKKLQNLGLLSGGERALTAIALLFAILHVRPVPFCVLDEVEAALDDANVTRFALYLKQFSAQTQFIVITHRKGTMEEADVLYGITMQESGVSRLVSVKLEESKEFVN